MFCLITIAQCFMHDVCPGTPCTIEDTDKSSTKSLWAIKHELKPLRNTVESRSVFICSKFPFLFVGDRKPG